MLDLDIKTDVLIVGAGPAGLSLAINLGKKHIPCILVDQKPRSKIGYKPCGDALSPNSTRRLFELCGILQPKGEEIAEDLATAHFRPVLGYELEIPFVSQTIDRLKYGQRLLKSLAEFPLVDFKHSHKVIDTIVRKNKVVGCKIRLEDGKKINIYAKIVADCSGVPGIVRRNIPENVSSKLTKKLPNTEIMMSYREIIETPKLHDYQFQMRIEYHEVLPPPGYFWIFSKGETTLNIGVGWIINEKNKHHNVKEVLQQLRNKFFPDAQVVDGAGDLLTGRLPLYSLVADGFITCGDAGALVNPISGEGHGPALLSGFYASEIIEKAIRNQKYDEETLWEYNKKIWNLYGYDAGLGIAVHKLLNAVPFSDFSYLFERGIISQEDIDAIMISYSVKLPIAKKIYQGIRKPGLLLKVAKGILLAEKIKKISDKYPSNPDGFDKWVKKIKKVEGKEL
ncbi:MAG: FAD-dependent monooxygenase [Candidatus Heimdallarchaeota archaeon]|nr:FAD-dependent monooxygenase [Candidatus Heimdallarchaeota archaeon]MCK4769696.1 FAD-dependent monooxygenase [Candidatus Heimdallarchaeota archaeon]